MDPEVLEPMVDTDGDQEMGVSMVERLYQDDMKWTHDMCEKDNDEMERMTGDMRTTMRTLGSN